MGLDAWKEDVEREEEENRNDPDWRGNKPWYEKLGDAITGAGKNKEAMDAATEAGLTADLAAIEEMRLQREQQGGQFDRQFAESQLRHGEMRDLLNPYVQAGTGALNQQQALSGALGPAAQQAAYDAIQAGPGFQSQLQMGETSILQNAAATGGVRGGNTIGAMAQYSPQLLGQAVNQRFGQLGNLTQMGQASAAGVGAAGMNVVPGIQPTDPNIANMYSQMGQTTAANILGKRAMDQNATSDVLNFALGAIGLFV